MATERQKKRKELREKRLQAEAKGKGDEKRQNMLKALAAIGFIAVVGIVVAVVAISSGGGSGDSAKSGDEIDKLLAGIPQKGTVLGEPSAKVTLVEFGDMQCPACKEFANTGAPEVIKGPVRSGKAKFEFRQWPILGPDSSTAAFAALAAAEQGRYWQYLENFYANQGIEGTGYVTDDFLKTIAEDAGVPDLDKWEKDRFNTDLEDELLNNEDEAANLGFTGTPSFAIQKGNGELEPIQFQGDANELIKAINQAN